MLEKGLDCNYVTKENHSLLYYATELNLENLAEKLLNNGAKLFGLEGDEQPIHIAVKKNNYSMFIKLLSLDSNQLNLRDPEGNLPIHLAV